MGESNFSEEEIRLNLAFGRINLAKQLFEDAKIMLEKESFRSANNRAFYSIEKSVKALLALKGLDASSHNALLKTFHNKFIHEENLFTKGQLPRT